MSFESIKKAVGYQAAELIQDGMHVGLGTGSTAFYFIERLTQRFQRGLKIKVLASSQRSLTQARQAGLPLLDIDAITSLDVTVDGADQIDHQKRMIKGGGGAHVREKILANMSRELIIIVDESKLVTELGLCQLPVEVLTFAHLATLHQIEKAGYKARLRTTAQNTLFLTDNQNYIIDIALDHLCDHPEKEHETLMHIPGVVDTGFFFQHGR